jgi:uncharacterized membrane protein YtjA (UPF0391 family)
MQQLHRYTRKARAAHPRASWWLSQPVESPEEVGADRAPPARHGECIAGSGGRMPATHSHFEEMSMLHYAVVFFVIALIAALFGFGGIAAGAAEIAKILFFIFIIIAAVTFVLSLLRRS